MARLRDRPRWQQTDVIDLLALVDVFLRLQPITQKVRPQDLIAYIEGEFKGRKISSKRIKVFERLLQHGTSALPHLSEEIRGEVINRAKAFEIDYLHRTPRKLRSGTNYKSPSIEPRSAKHKYTTSAPSVPSSVIAVNQVQDSVSPSPDAPSPDDNDSQADASSRVSLLRLTETPLKHDDEIMSFNETRSNAKLTQPDRQYKQEKGIGLTSDVRPPQCPTLDADSPESIREFFHVPILKGGPELFRHVWKDNNAMRKQVRDLQSRNDELEMKLDKSQISDDGSLHRKLEQYKERERRRNMFGPFPRNLTYDPHDRTLSIVRNKFETMRQKCKLIAYDNYFLYPNYRSVQEVPEDLCELISTVSYEEDSTTSDFVSIFAGIQKQISPELLTHCLIGAAIRQWVLKSPLRCISMLETPLLTHYRSMIATLSSSEVLQVVDFRAHRCLVESDDFQNTYLHTITQSATDRLLRLLEPCIKNSVTVAERGSMRENLATIFECALQIKCLTLSCEYLYDILWPIAGSSVKSEQVLNETQASSSDHQSKSSQSRWQVKLPLLPGICRYKRQEAGIVEYSNFCGKGKESLGSLEVVCEAIIISLDSESVGSHDLL